MATRIYLPSSGSAAVTPSAWNFPYQAATTYTLPGVLIKGTTALTTRTTATGTTSPRFWGVMRYVIGTLQAVEISGTVNLVMMCREANANANTTLAIAVKIIKPDGSDRSVLLTYIASDLASSPYEMTTTLSNRRAYNASETRPIPLTAQTPTAGDYLVIEIGFRSATTTTRNIDQRHGDNSGSDLADADGNTDDYAPWVEFSNTISWQGAIPSGPHAAIAVGVGVIIKQINKVLAISAAGVPLLVKQINLDRAVVATATPGLLNLIQINIAGTAVGSVFCFTSKLFIVLAEAVTIGVGTLTKQIQKVIPATVTGVGSCIKFIQKTVEAIAVGTPNSTKKIILTPIAAQVIGLVDVGTKFIINVVANSVATGVAWVGTVFIPLAFGAISNLFRSIKSKVLKPIFSKIFEE